MNENRTRIRAIVLGMMIISTVALAMTPAAQATPGTSSQLGDGGGCVTIYTDGPGVDIDPESCKRILTNQSAPATP